MHLNDIGSIIYSRVHQLVTKLILRWKPVIKMLILRWTTYHRVKQWVRYHVHEKSVINQYTQKAKTIIKQDEIKQHLTRARFNLNEEINIEVNVYNKIVAFVQGERELFYEWQAVDYYYAKK